jgi:hypothetical protein
VTINATSYVVRSSDRSLFSFYFGRMSYSQGLRSNYLARDMRTRGGVQATVHVLRILKRVRPQSSSHENDKDFRKRIFIKLSDQSASSSGFVRLAE